MNHEILGHSVSCQLRISLNLRIWSGMAKTSVNLCALVRILLPLLRLQNALYTQPTNQPVQSRYPPHLLLRINSTFLRRRIVNLLHRAGKGRVANHYKGPWAALLTGVNLVLRLSARQYVLCPSSPFMDVHCRLANGRGHRQPQGPVLRQPLLPLRSRLAIVPVSLP